MPVERPMASCTLSVDGATASTSELSGPGQASTSSSSSGDEESESASTSSADSSTETESTSGKESSAALQDSAKTTQLASKTPVLQNSKKSRTHSPTLPPDKASTSLQANSVPSSSHADQDSITKIPQRLKKLRKAQKKAKVKKKLPLKKDSTRVFYPEDFRTLPAVWAVPHGKTRVMNNHLAELLVQKPTGQQEVPKSQETGKLVASFSEKASISESELVSSQSSSAFSKQAAHQELAFLSTQNPDSETQPSCSLTLNSDSRFVKSCTPLPDSDSRPTSSCADKTVGAPYAHTQELETEKIYSESQVPSSSCPPETFVTSDAQPDVPNPPSSSQQQPAPDSGYCEPESVPLQPPSAFIPPLYPQQFPQNVLDQTGSQQLVQPLIEKLQSMTAPLIEQLLAQIKPVMMKNPEAFNLPPLQTPLPTFPLTYPNTGLNLPDPSLTFTMADLNLPGPSTSLSTNFDLLGPSATATSNFATNFNLPGPSTSTFATNFDLSTFSTDFNSLADPLVPFSTDFSLASSSAMFETEIGMSNLSTSIGLPGPLSATDPFEFSEQNWTKFLLENYPTVTVSDFDDLGLSASSFLPPRPKEKALAPGEEYVKVNICDEPRHMPELLKPFENAEQDVEHLLESYATQIFEKQASGFTEKGNYHHLQGHRQWLKQAFVDAYRRDHAFEKEKIQNLDKNLRERINYRYDSEIEKINKARNDEIDKLTKKMKSDNEEERRGLQAELSALTADGELPANFLYLPNRKTLRRRDAHGVTDQNIDHIRPENRIDFLVPIHQAHWINHADIESDLAVVDRVLGDGLNAAASSSNGPKSQKQTKLHTVQIIEGKLAIDGKPVNRGHTQTIVVDSSTYGTFPAIIISLSQHCMTVRSTIRGDPRHIAITFNDLETGRVKLLKKSAGTPFSNGTTSTTSSFASPTKPAPPPAKTSATTNHRRQVSAKSAKRGG